MSFGAKEVSRSRPCPICGKPDYCAFYYPDEKSEWIICKRTDVTTDCLGADGRRYHFIHLSKGQNSVFEDMDAHLRKKDEWMRENHVGPYREGKNNNYKEKREKNLVNATLKESSPKELKKVDEVRPLGGVLLDRVYRTLLNNLLLDPVHKAYLNNEGWSDDLIRESLVKSFPIKDFTRYKYKNFQSKNPYRKALAKNIMSELGLASLEGVPGAMQNSQGEWTFAGPSGILLPLYDGRGLIYGLRVRMDFMDVDVELTSDDEGRFYTYGGLKMYLTPFKGFYFCDTSGRKIYPKKQGYYAESGKWVEYRGKYRPLTSYHADEQLLCQGIDKNSYKGGCALSKGVSLYFNRQTDNPVLAYITEGEKKGIFTNYITHSPVITLPGVDAWSQMLDGDESIVQSLQNVGCQLFVIAYDADLETNKSVFKAQQKVIRALNERGLKVGIARWDEEQGKGLDDLLANGGRPEFGL